MPDSNEDKSVDRRWRHRLFVIWVAASMLVAIYIGFAGPFVTYFGEGWPVVALALPALMFFMVATGLGWLVLIAVSRKKQEGSRKDR